MRRGHARRCRGHGNTLSEKYCIFRTASYSIGARAEKIGQPSTAQNRTDGQPSGTRRWCGLLMLLGAATLEARRHCRRCNPIGMNLSRPSHGQKWHLASSKSLVRSQRRDARRRHCLLLCRLAPFFHSAQRQSLRRGAKPCRSQLRNLAHELDRIRFAEREMDRPLSQLIPAELIFERGEERPRCGKQ